MSTILKTNRYFDKAQTQTILVEAIERYMEDGSADVRCDECGCLILFEKKQDTTLIHHCLCGKYNGTLRGI